MVSISNSSLPQGETGSDFSKIFKVFLLFTMNSFKDISFQSNQVLVDSNERRLFSSTETKCLNLLVDLKEPLFGDILWHQPFQIKLFG